MVIGSTHMGSTQSFSSEARDWKKKHLCQDVAHGRNASWITSHHIILKMGNDLLSYWGYLRHRLCQQRNLMALFLSLSRIPFLLSSRLFCGVPHWKKCCHWLCPPVSLLLWNLTTTKEKQCHFCILFSSILILGAKCTLIISELGITVG